MAVQKQRDVSTLMCIKTEFVSSLLLLLLGARVCMRADLSVVVDLMKAHRITEPEENFEKKLTWSNSGLF